VTWTAIALAALAAAIVAAMLGFVLSRILWVWAPHPQDEGPICTDALASRKHELMKLAGWALVGGTPVRWLRCSSPDLLRVRTTLSTSAVADPEIEYVVMDGPRRMVPSTPSAMFRLLTPRAALLWRPV
jgi:hypothetical protein